MHLFVEKIVRNFVQEVFHLLESACSVKVHEFAY